MNREISRAQREWIEREMTVWRGLGLIGDEQSQALLGLYLTRDALEARQHAKGVFTLLALAATLVGLGVLLLVGYNWEEMSASLKVAAIFGTLIATHAAGVGLRYQAGWRRLSEVLFFLGCLFFGAAIWLLAQVFQITSSNYDALWWWAVGTLPFALLMETVLLHLLFAGLLALWVGCDVLSLERLWWGLPASGWSLPILVAPGLWWAYRKDLAEAVGIYAPLLAWWVVLQPIAWKMEANPTFFIGSVGALMLLIAALHPPGSLLAIPFRFYGIAVAGGTLVPLSFHGFNEEISPVSEGAAGISWQGGIEQLALILGLTAAALVAVYWLQPRTSREQARAGGTLATLFQEIAARQAVPCGLLVLFALLAVWVPATRDPWIPTIAANLAMIALALWLIRLGLSENRGRPFGAGVAYLLFWAVLRYADLFGEVGGMLGAAMIFFLCGAVLTGVALYWRSRKAVSLG